jgi:SAM-dependent methyltransferase
MNPVREIARIVWELAPKPVNDFLWPYLTDRIQIVLEEIEPTDEVLAIGCVRHSLEEYETEDPSKFLFTALNERADRVVGIDVVDTEVQKLRDRGYEARTADAQNMDLDETFDKIVAGEVIEHLENPGQFLSRCHDHLGPGGKLILTTPNPRRLQMLLWFLIGEENRANEEHTMWFDWFVMEELADRCGFDVRYTPYSPQFAPVSLTLYHLDLALNLSAGGWVFVLSPQTDHADGSPETE